MRAWRISQLLYFQRMLDLIEGVEGNAVECGVGYGKTFLLLVHLLYLENKGRTLWGFDSFAGFPSLAPEDEAPFLARFHYRDTSSSSIHALLKKSGLNRDYAASKVKIIEGFFHDTIPHADTGPIALLHIDVDLYESYLTVLKHFYPKVADGGVVLFDEYRRNQKDRIRWPGAVLAVERFFGDKAGEIMQDDQTGKYYLVKKRRNRP